MRKRRYRPPLGRPTSHQQPLLHQVRSLHAQRLHDAAVAEQLGISHSHAWRLRERLHLTRHPAPRPATTFDQALARAAWDEGHVDRAIAQRVGVTREAIQKWRTRNDLAPNGRKRLSGTTSLV